MTLEIMEDLVHRKGQNILKSIDMCTVAHRICVYNVQFYSWEQVKTSSDKEHTLYYHFKIKNKILMYKICHYSIAT